MIDDLVLGAGIAGLTTAWHLLNQGREVAVLEAAPRPGGVVHTLPCEGCLLEQGPQSLLASPAVLALLGQLGLRGAIQQADPAAAHRFVLYGGRLHEVPHSLVGALRSPLLGPRTLLRLLAEPLIRARRDGPPETVSQLLTRRVGPGIVHPMAEAAISGILAGDPALLDAESSFAELVQWEREHGGLFRGAIHRPRPAPGDPRGSLTLSGGLSTLIDALAMRLGSRLHLSTPVQRIERAGGHWTVHADTPWQPRRLWICVPPWVAAGLLQEPVLDLPAAPIAAVHLGFDRGSVPDLPGFGWLAPPSERQDVLGCLWVSSIFPSHAPGWALLRVMVGGARSPEVADMDAEALIARALRALREVQGIEAEPLLTQVSAHRPGIPQYPLGHARRIRSLVTSQPHLRLVGWGTSGIGLSHIIADAARQTAPTT